MKRQVVLTIEPHEDGKRCGGCGRCFFIDCQEIFKAPGFKTVQDFKDFDRFVVEGHYKTQSLLECLGKK